MNPNVIDSKNNNKRRTSNEVLVAAVASPYGNDASHRGGPAGFLQVSPDGSRITMPEFKGSNHINSLGNLLMDNRMGITVPLLEQGGML
jgi:hypothetical protein